MFDSILFYLLIGSLSYENLNENLSVVSYLSFSFFYLLNIKNEIFGVDSSISRYVIAIDNIMCTT